MKRIISLAAGLALTLLMPMSLAYADDTEQPQDDTAKVVTADPPKDEPKADEPKEESPAPEPAAEEKKQDTTTEESVVEKTTKVET